MSECFMYTGSKVSQNGVINQGVKHKIQFAWCNRNIMRSGCAKVKGKIPLDYH